MLGACVDGLFTVLCLITMEKDIVYIPTIRENVIIRYVEVMRILHLFSLRFVDISVHFSTFLVITLVLELITFSLVADHWITIHSIIWYQI